LLEGHELPDLKHLISTGAAQKSALAWQEFCDLGAQVPPAAIDSALNALTSDHLSDIMFTSGTTGRPKGVMSTHSQNIRAFLAWSDSAGLQASDRYLIVNPFFHVFGFKAGWLSCLLRGATAYPMPNFDVAQTAHRIESDNITFFPGPPTIFQTLIARMRDELGFKIVLSGYGLTESTGVVSMCAAGDSPETVATTCGHPIPGIELKIMMDDGTEAPIGEPGEIFIRGFNVMKGYLDDPVATAEAIDAEDWLHTGDVGVLDEKNYLRITDRKKEMYISGGFNCYPAEIERMLAAHPAIAMVAVIGVPDERMGEIGRALVVLRPGATATEQELITWSRETMANYKAPRHFKFIDALPINASGKIVRAELKNL